MLMLRAWWSSGTITPSLAKDPRFPGYAGGREFDSCPNHLVWTTC